MIFYVIELSAVWNGGVPNWKYPRNLESPRVSSPGFDNDSKMMKMPNLSGCHSGTTCRLVSERRGSKICAYGGQRLPSSSKHRKRMTSIGGYHSYEPDLNPVAHVWVMLGRRVAISHLSTRNPESTA
ncbi:DDE_3 domain-containing protein [Trichonephila clavipes]|nr:DDE_3 domain-containing protein [Trichonephila clavipes]